MTVGETLAEARCRAGLSIDELSERTKIRGIVIRSIEQDDYAACGGDLYVHGYVRAIAGALGIDAQPLIREYDLSRAGGPDEHANGPAGRLFDRSAGVTTQSAAPAGAAGKTAAPTAVDLPALPEPPAGQDDSPVLANPDKEGSAERAAEGFPGVAGKTAAPTAVDLPALPEPPAGQDASPFAPDPDKTRFDLPVISEPPAGQDVSPSPENLDKTRFDLPTVNGGPAPTAYDLPRLPEVAPTAEFPAAAPPAAAPPAAAPPVAAQPPGTAVTRYDLSAVPEDLAATGYHPGPAAESAETDSAAKIVTALSADPAGLQVPAGRHATVQPRTGQAGIGQASPGRRKRRGLFVAAGAVIVVAVGALSIHLATGSKATANTAAAGVPGSTASSAAKASAAVQANASAAARASADASASAAAKASQAAAKPPSRRVTGLPVASVTAYGPSGFADGDDPGNARNAITRNASQPWSTQWYTTPQFGMLKHGTGLLLDLGGKFTVTSVRLDLAQYQGADLQLRVGNGTSPQELRVAAGANNVGGAVRLTLTHPATARYLLIWFTKLPPDGSGHYAESVSYVAVTGRR